MSADLQSLRKRIDAVQAEAHALERTGASRSETSLALRAWADRLAEEGRARMRYATATASIDARPNESPFRLAVRNGAVDFGPALCALLGPAAVAKGFAQFVADLPDGPGYDERRARLNELADQMLRLEVQEERLVTALEATGKTVTRRADADPRAVLGLITFDDDEAAA